MQQQREPHADRRQQRDLHQPGRAPAEARGDAADDEARDRTRAVQRGDEHARGAARERGMHRLDVIPRQVHVEHAAHHEAPREGQRRLHHHVGGSREHQEAQQAGAHEARREHELGMEAVAEPAAEDRCEHAEAEGAHHAAGVRRRVVQMLAQEGRVHAQVAIDAEPTDDAHASQQGRVAVPQRGGAALVGAPAGGRHVLGHALAHGERDHRHGREARDAEHDERQAPIALDADQVAAEQRPQDRADAEREVDGAHGGGPVAREVARGNGDHHRQLHRFADAGDGPVDDHVGEAVRVGRQQRTQREDRNADLQHRLARQPRQQIAGRNAGHGHAQREDGGQQTGVCQAEAELLAHVRGDEWKDLPVHRVERVRGEQHQEHADLQCGDGRLAARATDR
ncbi:hypothetical protein FQZ97_709890 [compost metagenome]